MDDLGPQFAFYEKVRVHTGALEKLSVNGELGAVLGRVNTEDRGWYYTVYIYARRCCWCFFEEEMSPTGEKGCREDFFDGESVRVRVDDDGRGSLASHGPEGREEE